MLENAGKCCHVCQILINICNKFDNFRQFQYSNAVLNIKCTVADGYSNGNAHGPSRNDFTSPFYFFRIFTTRILFVMFLEVNTNVSLYVARVYTSLCICTNIISLFEAFLNLFSTRPREKYQKYLVNFLSYDNVF